MTTAHQQRARRLLQWGCFASAGAIVASILLWPVLTRAANPAQMCEAAARQAAARHDVPLDVLRTIALVETGRARGGQMEPWPWAIHSAGQGHWPDSRASAIAFARDRLVRGQRNIDLGCFQINYHWHAQNFASLDDMIDPARNADYAARLLKRHKARLGSWEQAAGAYHSATPALAARYMARFRQLHAGTDTAQAAPQPTTPDARRDARLSLFQTAGTPQMGSLVPMPVQRQQGQNQFIDLDQSAP